MKERFPCAEWAEDTCYIHFFCVIDIYLYSGMFSSLESNLHIISRLEAYIQYIFDDRIA